MTYKVIPDWGSEDWLIVEEETGTIHSAKSGFIIRDCEIVVEHDSDSDKTHHYILVTGAYLEFHGNNREVVAIVPCKKKHSDIQT